MFLDLFFGMKRSAAPQCGRMRHEKNRGNGMFKEMWIGIVAALFFATTFILNRAMNLSGGTAWWSACLRYFFSVPLLLLMLRSSDNLAPVWKEIRRAPGRWFLWSTVGFGGFYLPLTLASEYGASWMIAGTWQLVIVTGILLTPIWGERVPRKNLLFSLIILLGVFLLQLGDMKSATLQGAFLSVFLVLVAAVCYPLGNRMMMHMVKDRLGSTQRVFGMTICSLPFWFLTASIAFGLHGAPSSNQLIQSFFVALFSGVIATVLFFRATDMARHDAKRLSIVESTQSGEVIFALLGGVLFLQDPFPNLVGMAGLCLIVVGMILHSLSVKEKRVS